MPVLYEALSRNIKTARKKAKHTQEHTAELLGMSTMNYGRLERGQRKVSLEQLSKMAEVFGCSVFHLLDGAFPVEISTIFDERSPSIFSEKVTAIMADCSTEEQELIYEICRLIVYQRFLNQSNIQR